MKQSGKVIGGILLLFIGASVLFGMLGINLGGLMGLVFLMNKTRYFSRFGDRSG